MIGDHNSQYQPGASPITRMSGCTWTTGATGIAVVTGGRYTPTPDKVHSLVKRSEETSPATPGWSLEDLDLAMARFGMGFEVHKNEGWAAVVKARPNRFLVTQGDSDQFNGATCSGAFDGLHCVGVDGSRVKVENGVTYWWLHDPICPAGRWERPAIIRRYAEKLAPGVFFGYFTQRIPVSGWHWRIAPIPPAKSRSFRQFHLDSKGRITSVTWQRTTTAISAPCTAPKNFEGANGQQDQTLVRLINPGQPRNGWLVAGRYAKEN